MPGPQHKEYVNMVFTIYSHNKTKFCHIELCVLWANLYRLCIHFHEMAFHFRLFCLCKLQKLSKMVVMSLFGRYEFKPQLSRFQNGFLQITLD